MLCDIPSLADAYDITTTENYRQKQTLKQVVLSTITHAMQSDHVNSLRTSQTLYTSPVC